MSKGSRYNSRGVRREGNVAFLKDARSTVRIDRTSTGGSGEVPTTAGERNATVSKSGGHTVDLVKPLNWASEDGIRYVCWGSNNRRPIELMEEARRSGILRAGLRTRVNAHYGAGPIYYRLRADGMREVAEPIELHALSAEMRAYHHRCRLEQACRDRVMNYEWWGWVVNEHILSNDYRKIVSTRPLKTMNVRWSEMEDHGRVELCLYNANWGLPQLKHRTIAIPACDPWATPEEVREWAKANGLHKFVRASYQPMSEATMYPEQDWTSLYDNQWLQNNNSIPRDRAQLRDKSVSIKYHIQIPEEYFAAKYRDHWEKWTPEERTQKEDEFLETLNDFLTGADNSHKAFISRYGVDEMGKPLPGWIIKPLEDNSKDSILTSIADSEKGNSEILATIRVDPTLLGQGAPGGKLGAGSGSDKAEAIRIMHALGYADREVTTDDWYFTSQYNQWDPHIYMGYRQMELSAMDATPDTQPTANPS
jgi:hypothetical protein